MYEEFGIAKEITLHQIDFGKSSKSKFSLTCRVTADELLKEYGRKVKDAQSEYRMKIMEATTELTDNYKMCKEIDEQLGILSNEEIHERQVNVLDENERYNCPIHKCGVKTVNIRRHLKNHNLTNDKFDSAIDYSKLFARNISTTKSHGKTRVSNTHLVNKKRNYKVCPICNNLYRNMTDHITNSHKIKKTDVCYENYVKDCEVIPTVYTKLKSGRAVKLEGEELKEAKEKYEDEIVKQQKTLTELKCLRAEMETLQKRLKHKDDRKEKVRLEEIYREYKEKRYEDNRVMSAKLKNWSVTFAEYLRQSGDNNPRRGVVMAMDVLLANHSGKQDFAIEELLNIEELKKILQAFMQHKSTNNSSKMKYLGYFERLLKFVTCTVSSPEYIKNSSKEELILRNEKIKDASNEIRSIIKQLSRNSKTEINESSKEKLKIMDDLVDVLRETQKYLNSLVDRNEKDWQAFDFNEIRKIRNSLIVVATIRMSRTSKELIEMTVSECKDAEERLIKGELLKAIKISAQKLPKSCKQTPVVYSEIEFKALCLYIKYLRPKMRPTNISNVFFSCNSLHSRPTPLSLLSVYKILQQYTTNSGKKLALHALKGRHVRNTGMNDLSDYGKQTLALQHYCLRMIFPLQFVTDNITSTYCHNSVISNISYHESRGGGGLDLKCFSPTEHFWVICK